MRAYYAYQIWKRSNQQPQLQTRTIASIISQTFRALFKSVFKRWRQ